MEGRAFKNDPVDHFSEGASLPRWGVTRTCPDRALRASGAAPGIPSTRDGTLATKLSRRVPSERSEWRGCKPAFRLPAGRQGRQGGYGSLLRYNYPEE